MALLRIAVVGVGSVPGARSRAYLATISRLRDHYQLCALCDRNEGALAEAGDEFNVAARYRRLDEMLRAEQPDVVLVLVPTDGQTPAALTVVAHGCHLITEIPYAITLGFGDAIASLAQRHGVKWEVAENVWRQPREQLKQQIVSQGLLGDLKHARLWYPCGSYHGFNAVRMILRREVRRVLGYARQMPVPPYTSYGGTVETTCWWESGLLEFEGDITCLYEMPPARGARSRGWEIEGERGYLAWHTPGEDALVLRRNGQERRYPFEETFVETPHGRVLAGVRVATDPPVEWHNPFVAYGIGNHDDIAKAAILLSLHRAVTEGGAPDYGATNARRDMELWIALRESALRGNTWVHLPLSEETSMEACLREAYIRRYGHDPTQHPEALHETVFSRLSVMWTVAGWL